MSRFNYISAEAIAEINEENFTFDSHKSNHWETLKKLSVQTGEDVYDIVSQSISGNDPKLSAKPITLVPFNGVFRNATKELLHDMVLHLGTKAKVKLVARFCGYRVHEKLLNSFMGD